MAAIRMALLEYDIEQGANLQAYLRAQKDVQWAGWFLSVNQMQKEFDKNGAADVSIVCLHGAEKDGSVLSALEKADMQTRLVLYAENTDRPWHEVCKNLPVGYVVYRHMPREVLYRRALMVGQKPGAAGRIYQRPEGITVSKSTVATALKKTGVPPKLCGYRYLCYAVELALSHPDWLDNMTETLYAAVAKKYGSTVQRVERSMRYAVENAFDSGNLAEIEKLFGYTVDKDKGKPSNREYIARIADSLRLQQA